MTVINLFMHQSIKIIKVQKGLKFEFIPGATCLHCRNGGWVVLDHDETSAPCPMCNLGGVLDDKLDFWGVGNPTRFTWNHGLTVHHTGLCEAQQETGPYAGSRCGAAAHGEAGVCEWHSKPDEIRIKAYRRGQHAKPRVNIRVDRKAS